MLQIDKKANISSTAFKKMSNLRFLRIYTLPSTLLFPNGLVSLPKTLRYLYWQFYPFKSLPSNVCLDNLVELHMRHSKLKKLGNFKEVRIFFSEQFQGCVDLYLNYCHSSMLCYMALYDQQKLFSSNCFFFFHYIYPLTTMALNIVLSVFCSLLLIIIKKITLKNAL